MMASMLPPLNSSSAQLTTLQPVSMNTSIHVDKIDNAIDSVLKQHSPRPMGDGMQPVNVQHAPTPTPTMQPLTTSISDATIETGAKFTSYADFERIFEDWKNHHFHPFRVASSETLKTPDGAPNDIFKYRYIVFHCAHYGAPRMRGAGKRPNQNYMPCGCRAMLRLNYSWTDNALRITTLNAVHNGHELNAEAFHRFTSKLRRSSPLNTSGLSSPTSQPSPNQLMSPQTENRQPRAPRQSRKRTRDVSENSENNPLEVQNVKEMTSSPASRQCVTPSRRQFGSPLNTNHQHRSLSNSQNNVGSPMASSNAEKKHVIQTPIPHKPTPITPFFHSALLAARSPMFANLQASAFMSAQNASLFASMNAVSNQCQSSSPHTTAQTTTSTLPEHTLTTLSPLSVPGVSSTSPNNPIPSASEPEPQSLPIDLTSHMKREPITTSVTTLTSLSSEDDRVNVESVDHQNLGKSQQNALTVKVDHSLDMIRHHLIGSPDVDVKLNQLNMLMCAWQRNLHRL